MNAAVGRLRCAPATGDEPDNRPGHDNRRGPDNRHGIVMHYGGSPLAVPLIRGWLQKLYPAKRATNED
ncbi:hypothetical protein D3227_05580 [Mesorhizobium waimense]|uniref:Uncharacterized protein n=1 Tax=Mesorhizobium waimense TaxID=1300307 RepID=A0A3A5KX04_9HYPH|nr:hypothetical protein D3227_05580 [Mesorhizobium waimense]